MRRRTTKGLEHADMEYIVNLGTGWKAHAIGDIPYPSHALVQPVEVGLELPFGCRRKRS